MNTIPAHPSLSDEPTFNVQTLGGKIVKPSAGDPIYLLGSFQNNSLHLSHLDALVQVRPQLPHLDAVDELERNRGTAALARAKGKDGIVLGDISAPPAGQSARPESKAIDIKLKSGGPSSHNNDLGTNINAQLLRAIQQEPWQTFDWIDEDDVEAHQQAEKALYLSIPLDNDVDTSVPPNLESAITNSEWLDLMSAPRIDHGKKGNNKGLMGKVRGRDRERQRRKKNEVAKKERATAAAHENPLTAGDEETNHVVSGPVDGEAQLPQRQRTRPMTTTTWTVIMPARQAQATRTAPKTKTHRINNREKKPRKSRMRMRMAVLLETTWRCWISPLMLIFPR